ncbi:MAG TPA: tRNA (adenosine(37)-N6)-threonylcarbamoyltransferase complex ATPase subunit type 1 TsaE [Bacteroidia bacterium]|jgi:tRNA threonylcarbamoyladenosine biosynthesis protein TsaE|nr:tRNA (adenosine(37)-N6)-threonylcarbamoyltransferase complex ATPase subunit type 1 TsaE [Bacteroidia bacterium]
MNKLSFASVSLDVLDEVAKDIIAYLEEKKILLFYGEMGSGKTTLIKEICRQLGVTGSMSSPTYGLVNEYRTTDKKIIYHFDLYRVKNLEECLDIGMEEYLYSGNYCFIEWPDVAKQIIPEKAMKVFIEGNGELRGISVE